MSDGGGARLLAALDMFEVGIQMQRSRLRREHPDAADTEIADMLEAWLLDRPGAPHGDAVGRPSRRFL